MQEILIHETRPTNNSTTGFQINTVTRREVGFTADLEKSWIPKSFFLTQHIFVLMEMARAFYNDFIHFLHSLK